MFFKKQGFKKSNESLLEQGLSAKPIVIGIGLMMGVGLMGFGMTKCMGVMKGMMASMCPDKRGPSFATPELQILFGEWLEKLDHATLALLKHQREVDVTTLAAILNISEESTILLVAHLARKGKVDLSISTSGKSERS
jgi:hypothetical protein